MNNWGLTGGYLLALLVNSLGRNLKSVRQSN